MNELPARNILTGILLTWLLATSMGAVWMLAHEARPFATELGLFLSSAAPLAYFLRNLRAHASVTPAQTLGFSIASGLGVAICMTASWRYGPVAGSAHLAAGASLIGWVVYLRWLRPTPARQR